MKTIYFLNSEINKISYYLAIEDYFLNHTNEEVFFVWNIDKSIIIGKNQLLEGEVNINFTKKNNIPIYRRPSGGGAIYADKGCFMFSFISRNINKEEVYKSKLMLIVEALKKIGIDAYFSGRNDLMFKEKKFSGNAFYSNEKGSVLHGTFLFDTNLSDLVRSITPDNEKLISKGIKSVSERVINLKEYSKFSKLEMIEYLNNEISKEKIYLTNDDIIKIKEIEKKYLDDNWIYKNNPPYTYFNKERFSYGKIELYIDIYKNKVKNFSITGDFFEVKNINEFLDSFKGIEFSKKSFKERLNNINIENYILNSKNDDLIKMIFEEEDCGN